MEESDEERERDTSDVSRKVKSIKERLITSDAEELTSRLDRWRDRALMMDIVIQSNQIKGLNQNKQQQQPPGMQLEKEVRKKG